MDNGGALNSCPEKQLVEQLSDPEYRKAFVEGHATDTVAFQLRAMRKARGWEQRDVAEKLGNRKLQPMISRYENPDYGKYSISTLLELATAFDVALAVRFVPFSELVEWDLTLSPAKECPSGYDEDKKLGEIARCGVKGQTVFPEKLAQSESPLETALKATQAVPKVAQGAALPVESEAIGASQMGMQTEISEKLLGVA